METTYLGDAKSIYCGSYRAKSAMFANGLEENGGMPG
jgi:hypothetical protein